MIYSLNLALVLKTWRTPHRKGIRVLWGNGKTPHTRFGTRCQWQMGCVYAGCKLSWFSPDPIHYHLRFDSFMYRPASYRDIHNP